MARYVASFRSKMQTSVDIWEEVDKRSVEIKARVHKSVQSVKSSKRERNYTLAFEYTNLFVCKNCILEPRNYGSLFAAFARFSTKPAKTIKAFTRESQSSLSFAHSRCRARARCSFSSLENTPLNPPAPHCSHPVCATSDDDAKTHATAFNNLRAAILFCSQIVTQSFLNKIFVQ